MGITLRGNGNETDKRDISTLQARGHFYLALTHLIRIMGHSGVVPSSIIAANVPTALARLKNATQSESGVPPPERISDVQDKESHEQSVSLKNRALPLIELLSAAVKKIVM